MFVFSASIARRPGARWAVRYQGAQRFFPAQHEQLDVKLARLTGDFSLESLDRATTTLSGLRRVVPEPEKLRTDSERRSDVAAPSDGRKRLEIYDWKERGGSEPILKRIAYEVFGLTV